MTDMWHFARQTWQHALRGSKIDFALITRVNKNVKTHHRHYKDASGALILACLQIFTMKARERLYGMIFRRDLCKGSFFFHLTFCIQLKYS